LRLHRFADTIKKEKDSDDQTLGNLTIGVHRKERRIVEFIPIGGFRDDGEEGHEI